MLFTPFRCCGTSSGGRLRFPGSSRTVRNLTTAIPHEGYTSKTHPARCHFLLHTIFQPTPDKTPRTGSQVDPGTSFVPHSTPNSSDPPQYTSLLHTHARIPGQGKRVTLKLGMFALLAKQSLQKKVRGEQQVLPLINKRLTLTLTGRSLSTSHLLSRRRSRILSFREFRISDPIFPLRHKILP